VWGAYLRLFYPGGLEEGSKPTRYTPEYPRAIPHKHHHESAKHHQRGDGACVLSDYTSNFPDYRLDGV